MLKRRGAVVTINKSCCINDNYVIDINIETITKSMFDLEIENAEFTITEADRLYYCFLSCRSSIGKAVLNVTVSNSNNRVISEHKYYLVNGLYHFMTENKTIYISIDENLRGYVGNVDTI